MSAWLDATKRARFGGDCAIIRAVRSSICLRNSSFFARILTGPNLPRSPREATIQCRAYIRSYCTARTMSVADKFEARRVEGELRAHLKPAFNGIAMPAADDQAATA